MIPITSGTALLARLVDSAARAMVLAAAVHLTFTALRIRATSLRLAAWTVVLYAALAMPVLGQMLPRLSVPMPSLMQMGLGNGRSDDSHASSSTPAISSDKDTASVRGKAGDRSDIAHVARSSFISSPAPLRGEQKTSVWTTLNLAILCAGIYLTGVLVLLARFFIGLAFSHRLIRASQAIPDRRLYMKLAAHARSSGLHATPRVAESELISVPVTMGAIRPVIMLPPSWPEWDDAKLDSVVAHEVSHVARRDPLTHHVSLLHRAIFWFSPFAWWLDRHLAELAEEASDEAALSGGADRHEYARALLEFLEALHVAPGRVWWQGVSMAKSGQAEKRLERILAWRGAVTMGSKKSGLQKSVLIAVVTITIPIAFVAASVAPAAQRPALPPSPSAQAWAPDSPSSPLEVSSEPAPPTDSSMPITPGTQAATPSSRLAPVAPVSPVTPDAPVGAAVPDTPVAPVAAVVPDTPRGARGLRSSGSQYSYAYGYDDETRFVIVSGKSDAFTMSGSTQDARHAERLKSQIAGDFIWFQRDEKSYVIRDQATIDRARKLWAPQDELGKKQEELGKQQEALGKQQEALGKRMEEVKVKVPDLTAEMDRLKAKLQKLGSAATQEQLGDLQSEIGDLQSRIGEIQSQAGDQQSKIGEDMSALGEQQGKLGEQQGELGRQQAELGEKAAQQMKELLDESLKNGTAQPEPGSGTI